MGPFAALLARQQAGLDQLLHVVTDRGLADVEHIDEVAGAHRFAPLGRDMRQESQARRIGESLELLRDPVGFRRPEGCRVQRAALVRGFEAQLSGLQ